MTFPFPMLDGSDVRIRFEDTNELLLNVFFGTKFEAFHVANDIPIELIYAQRFATDEMRIR